MLMGPTHQLVEVKQVLLQCSVLAAGSQMGDLKRQMLVAVLSDMLKAANSALHVTDGPRHQRRSWCQAQPLQRDPCDLGDVLGLRDLDLRLASLLDLPVELATELNLAALPFSEWQARQQFG